MNMPQSQPSECSSSLFQEFTPTLRKIMKSHTIICAIFDIRTVDHQNMRPVPYTLNILGHSAEILRASKQ